MAENWQLSIPPIDPAAFALCSGENLVPSAPHELIDGTIRLMYRAIARVVESGEPLVVDLPSILEYPPHINRSELEALRLKYPEDVLRGVLRLPAVVVAANLGLGVIGDRDETGQFKTGQFSISDTQCIAMAAAWADILINAQNCRDYDEFQVFVCYRVKEAGRLLVNSVLFHGLFRDLSEVAASGFGAREN